MGDTSQAGRAERLRWVWSIALAAFVLAGATGVLFRFGLAYGIAPTLNLTNIRHAHSHLMYFGWVTPALMALIWYYLPKGATARHSSKIRWVLGSVFAAAAVAYPLFLAFGYTSVQMGAARMPLAMMGAGLNIFGWYGFVALYAVVTRNLPRTRPLQLWDMALTFLVLATFGAWSLSLLKPLGLHDPFWTKALTHVFLDLFSEGWFVLGVLGVAWSILQDTETTARHWSLRVIGAGLPFTFILALPASSLSTGLQLVGCIGGAFVGVGLMAIVAHLWKRLPAGEAWIWGVPLALLVVKALAQLSNSLIPGVWWAGEHGLRILYLHVMLLGVVSLGLVAAAHDAWGAEHTRGMRAFYGAVGLLLLSLVPLTSWWPAAWRGMGMPQLAAWMALLPVLAAGWMVGRGVGRRAARPSRSRRSSVKTA